MNFLIFDVSNKKVSVLLKNLSFFLIKSIKDPEIIHFLDKDLRLVANIGSFFL